MRKRMRKMMLMFGYKIKAMREMMRAMMCKMKPRLGVHAPQQQLKI